MVERNIIESLRKLEGTSLSTIVYFKDGQSRVGEISVFDEANGDFVISDERGDVQFNVSQVKSLF
ncbi:hypothetical protein C4569_03900 [Candidatus Parcubacteria bacterium]|nr:MAG: hypothetical protein C4569_03900 [Candidatus Parcubacteria bacterium]